MTEDQAKTKLCCGPTSCGMRVPHPTIVDHIGDPCSMRVCVGSDCMAWREQTTTTTSSQAVNVVQTVVCGGFCGLAGKC